MIEEVFTCSFQAAKFRIQIDNCNVTLLSIYHPPYSTANPVTDRMFIDNFTEWICNQLVMSNHDNKLIILGEHPMEQPAKQCQDPKRCWSLQEEPQNSPVQVGF